MRPTSGFDSCLRRGFAAGAACEHRMPELRFVSSAMLTFHKNLPCCPVAALAWVKLLRIWCSFNGI